MKIRTLIVDDEPLARERIRRMLTDVSDVEIIGEAESGKEAVAFINEKKPELIILDIQIPEMNGFEVLQSVGAENVRAVIFVTAYDHYAIQAFEIHALDYLLKPFGEERLQHALERAREQLDNSRVQKIDEQLISLLDSLKHEKKYAERILVKSGGHVYFLSVGEIDWIEAAGNYVKLHVGRESHLLRETMQAMEARLNPQQFLRIHRSTLVNINRIKELYPLFSGDYNVILKTGVELTLSRNYRDRLLELFDV
jgi:two-component system, LytTR family, response regulator